VAYYTNDLREKALAYESTHTVKETSEAFGVGMRAIFRWKKQKRETGNVDRKPLNRKPRKLDMEGLRRYAEAHPDAYLWEMAKEFRVGTSCIHRGLKKMKITLKKKRGPTKNGTRRSVRSMKGSYPSMKKRT
jgi:transposase